MEGNLYIYLLYRQHCSGMSRPTSVFPPLLGHSCQLVEIVQTFSSVFGDGVCCDGVCCDGVCCDGVCCDGVCWDGMCCNSVCCDGVCCNGVHVLGWCV